MSHLHLALIYTLVIGFSHLFINTTVLCSIPYFPQSQLYSTNIGLENVDGFVGAVGDFDSDKYNDMFVISPQRDKVTLWLWDKDGYKFKSTEVVIKVDERAIIDGIVLTDFNLDGKLDMLVQSHFPENASILDLNIYLGDYEKFGNPVNLGKSEGQVSIANFAGSTAPSLLGNGLSSGGEYIRSIWRSKGSYEWEILPFMESASVHSFSVPHSNAFVDLDGDCAADLFVSTTTHHEIWLFDQRNGEFVLNNAHSRMERVPGQGQITFADFDGDGSIDMLFPVCYPSDTCEETNHIFIIYNQQMGICSEGSGGNASKCRQFDNLCIADPNFVFGEFTPSDRSSSHAVVIDMSKFGQDIYLQSNTLDSMPVTLRAGDYNLDRFPDLLVPVRSKDNSKSYIILLENVPCTNDTCGSDATAKSRRTFSPVLSGTNDLMSIHGAFGAFWFDINESGTNDIIVLVQEGQSSSIQQSEESTSKMTVRVLKNNFFNDAYFLKLLSLNGICAMNCGLNTLTSPKPYGVNKHGTTFKYTLTNLSGQRIVQMVPQLPQSAYMPLQTPYIVSGIGRPSNYVDYIFMGLSIFPVKNGHSQRWPAILPNSQVVIAPYPYLEPENWTLELYILPSGAFIWISLSIVICLIVSGMIVIFLQYQEKKSDEREKREQEHLFSFRAM